MRIRDIHVASIRGLTGSHYTPAQIAVWSGSRDPSHYRQSMREGLTMWVAELEGRIAGFAAFSGEQLHLLYVHPGDARRGAGSALLAAVESAARRENQRQILCPASLNAVVFYRKHGFRRVGGGRFLLDGIAIPYVNMRKVL